MYQNFFEFLSCFYFLSHFICTRISQAPFCCLAACFHLPLSSSFACLHHASAELGQGRQLKTLLYSISCRAACCHWDLSLVAAILLLWHICWSTGPNLTFSCLNITTAVCFWIIKAISYGFSGDQLKKTDNVAHTALLRLIYLPVSKTVCLSSVHHVSAISLSLRVGRLWSTQSRRIRVKIRIKTFSPWGEILGASGQGLEILAINTPQRSITYSADIKEAHYLSNLLLNINIER